MQSFNTIGLIGRLASASTQYSLKRLIAFLTDQKLEVLLDKETSTILPDCDLPVATRPELAQACDLIIVVGGDGSLLSAARAFAGHDVQILGINRGRLGFLTDISPEDIENKVGEVLSGRYLLEQRFLLESTLLRDDEVMSTGLALNDVVIHPGKLIRMIEFELYIDDEFVYRQRSDGLIISSPTGSTAYALSGGGPIMHPNLDAVVLVPLYPHTLSSRPIVVGGNSEIRLIVCENNNLNPLVTCDGQSQTMTQPGDTVFITKSEKRLKLIHPEGHNFYETCRSKLGWASHTGN
ncbi:NAD(+) kinase [Teredinibacter turnerae]|uniref:NAD kinase n=1 Tax=Teredinibacter turnerae (strain ATCC 39867 / T7901) TaxID=377629 RepID=NADK_TERTT|nr:NAD(+) kinase [Teredinibacter turnerae]C5BL09.1 RecName: Full=NAD kinase; AltName: Full=ATP-dependent NAD kinase [Teredinibacter turnerae T7901]ACR14005.1 putative inorganic polyphosphate/ATP-NAD kinase [Teredinibacter turnerae T7901]